MLLIHPHILDIPFFNSSHFSHSFESENQESSLTSLYHLPVPICLLNAKFHWLYLLSIFWTHLFLPNLMASAPLRSFSKQNYSNILQTNLRMTWLHPSPVQALPRLLFQSNVSPVWRSLNSLKFISLPIALSVIQIPQHCMQSCLCYNVQTLHAVLALSFNNTLPSSCLLSSLPHTLCILCWTTCSFPNKMDYLVSFHFVELNWS